MIIGGSSGMGLSAAKACLHEGAHVLVTALDEEGARHAALLLGDGASAIAADATKEGTAEQAIEACVRTFGDFNSLFHVAGGSGRRFGDGPLHTLTMEGWDRTLELNIGSLMLSNRAAIRWWLDQQKSGTILNMGSALADHPAPDFFATAAYATAKSAVSGFSRSIAAYYASNNIRVNVLAPGLTDTPMARRAMENPDIQAFVSSKQRLEGGRSALPTDMDGAVVFLLSPASSFITGQVLAVDGGWGLADGQIPAKSS